MMRPHREDPSRRQFLHRACRCGAGLAAMSALPLLESCTGNSGPPPLRVRQADLDATGRVVVVDHDVPIEVSRTEDGVRARSLLCTHQGCRVQWKEDAGHYHCPCHDGIFDASGTPVQGPPRAALREFGVVEHDDFVQVDTASLRESA